MIKIYDTTVEKVQEFLEANEIPCPPLADLGWEVNLYHPDKDAEFNLHLLAIDSGFDSVIYIERVR